MSIFKKYEANLAEFKDFRRGSLRNLANVTNTQTNSGTKLMDAGLYCVNNTTQYTTVPDNTQFALGRDPFVFFASFRSIDDLGIHHIYSLYNPSSPPRIAIRRYPANVTNIGIADSNGVTTYSSGSTVYNGEKVQILVVVIPASNLAYVYKNGIFEHTINIATLTGNFNFVTNSTIGVGVGRIQDVNDLLYYAGLFKNTSMTGREVAQFYAEMEAMDQNIWSKSVARGDGKNLIDFKGEFAALARETTVSSGFLENTGAQILSGSFRVMLEKNGIRLEKIIECVSSGSLYIAQANVSPTEWRMYVNSGAGYVAVADSLITAPRTIAMTAGQKLIWASEDERRSIYNLEE